MDNTWVEITASGPREAKDEAIEALIEAGSPGILELAPSEGAKKRSQKAAIKGYLSSENKGSGEENIKNLEARLDPLKWSLSLSDYKEEDWSKKWKDAIRPVEVTGTGDGRRLIVRASWHKIESRPDDIIIVVDPGMAFGTGSHPSTRMCLRALFYILSTEDGNGGYGTINSMLDIGSGTGILSIAGKLLGLKKVQGIDIESESIKIAKENAKLNNTRCTFKEVELTEPLKDITGTYDLVVANIISNELIRIAGAMAERVNPDAFIVLSGILSDEAGEVTKVFAALGFTPYMRYAESATDQGGGHWVTLVFRKSL
jgi:ribosomal protein L11 methyltransferase